MNQEDILAVLRQAGRPLDPVEICAALNVEPTQRQVTYVYDRAAALLKYDLIITIQATPRKKWAYNGDE